MCRIVLIMLLSVCQLLHSQPHVNYTLTVYPQHKQSGNVARMLSSSEDWTKIGVLNTLLWQGQELGKWRVVAVFHSLKTNREVTLQLGLRTPDNQFISFNFPKKSENEPRTQEVFSNWFEQKKRGLGKELLQEPTQAYVRLLGDVQSKAILSIKKLTLERWQDSNALPLLQEINKLDEMREEAKYVAIDFFDFLLEQKRLSFPRIAAFYDLDTGELFNSKNWNTLGLGRYATRSEYLYRFYDYQQMNRRFPELFTAEREWRPSLESFLFLAYTPQRQVTKFIIEKKEQTWKLVGLSSSGNNQKERVPKSKNNELKVASHVAQNFLAYHPQNLNGE